MRVSDMRSEHGGQPCVMVLRKPLREDVELLIAGEHRIERRQAAESFFHYLRPCVHENAVHSGDDGA